MITDIERLHKIVDQRNGGDFYRQKGKTFSKCHDVAGMIELELFNVVVVFISHYNDVKYIFPMLREVFNDHELELKNVDQYTLISNDCLIKFFSERDRYKLKCFEDCAVVEMLHGN